MSLAHYGQQISLPGSVRQMMRQYLTGGFGVDETEAFTTEVLGTIHSFRAYPSFHHPLPKVIHASILA